MTADMGAACDECDECESSHLMRLPLGPTSPSCSAPLAPSPQSSQLVLVSGWHRSLGLDDHLFVLGGSVVMDTIQNVGGSQA